MIDPYRINRIENRNQVGSDPLVFVDMPPEAAKSLYTAEVTEKVAKFIPTVRVQEVTWGAGAQGNLIAKVVITSA